MATAVQQLNALQKAKSRAVSRFSRISAPLAAKASNIASNAQAAEDKDVINRYNDGLISNEDFVTYLEGVLKRPTTTATERTTITNLIRDTEGKVQVEALEADYQNTLPNTAERASAAQAISNYWASRADSLVPGTPAHSSALQKSGQWSKSAESTQTAFEKSERTLLRSQKELQISSLDESDSAMAEQKAIMFNELAKEAMEDGEIVEANKYQTMSNNYITSANEHLVTENKKSILTSIMQLKNDWHSGAMTPDQVTENLNALYNQAIELGDPNVVNTIFNMADTISKDIEKGVNRGTLGEIPIVKGRGSGSGTSSVIDKNSGMTWEEMDDAYIENMRAIDEAVRFGGLPPEMAKILKTDQMLDRQADLKNRMEILEQAEAQGKRIPYKGVNSKALVLQEQFDKELSVDASAPFAGSQAYSPVLNIPLNTILDHLEKPLVDAINNIAMQKGDENGNYELTEEDLQTIAQNNLSDSVYVSFKDANGMPQFSVLKRNDPTLRAFVQVDDSLFVKPEQPGKQEFASEEEARAEFMRIYGVDIPNGWISKVKRADPTDPTEKREIDVWEVVMPSYIDVDNRDGTTERWLQDPTSLTWSPTSEEAQTMMQGLGGMTSIYTKSVLQEKANDARNTQLESAYEGERDAQKVYSDMARAEQNTPGGYQRVLAEKKLNNVFPTETGVVTPGMATNPMTGKPLTSTAMKNLAHPSLKLAGVPDAKFQNLLRPELKDSIKLNPVPLDKNVEIDPVTLKPVEKKVIGPTGAEVTYRPENKAFAEKIISDSNVNRPEMSLAPLDLPKDLKLYNEPPKLKTTAVSSGVNAANSLINKPQTQLTTPGQLPKLGNSLSPSLGSNVVGSGTVNPTQSNKQQPSLLKSVGGFLNSLWVNLFGK